KDKLREHMSKLHKDKLMPEDIKGCLNVLDWQDKRPPANQSLLRTNLGNGRELLSLSEDIVCDESNLRHRRHNKRFSNKNSLFGSDHDSFDSSESLSSLDADSSEDTDSVPVRSRNGGSDSGNSDGGGGGGAGALAQSGVGANSSGWRFSSSQNPQKD